MAPNDPSLPPRSPLAKVGITILLALALVAVVVSVGGMFVFAYRTI